MFLFIQATSNKPSGKKSPPHSSSRGTKSSTSTGESYCSPQYTGRDEDYWVKDTSDLDRLVNEVMQQTNYPDPSFVRETLVEYNFDMNATMDVILALSVVMHQRDDIAVKSENNSDDFDQSQRDSISATAMKNVDIDGVGIDNLASKSIMVVTDMDEQCEDVGDSEDSGMPG
jgi:hypothetical protein